ncbi:MAG: hypothetical protein OXI22_17765 [Defluviicoccus sp.]|nr:hypothetical protein [Defluviicoccus sp.]
MTPELIAILAVGVALTGVMLQGQRTLGARMDRLDGRMDRLEAEIKEVRERLEAEIKEVRDRLEVEMKEVRDRLSRLEGKMDFLEGHIVRRDEAGAPAE